jgi:uncharacterized protein YfkK (UPF0435 family)
METNLPLHVKKFNDKLRVMNQANAKILTLNAQEARDLQAEIYDLMATIASLSTSATNDSPAIINVSMDGGSFK